MPRLAKIAITSILALSLFAPSAAAQNPADAGEWVPFVIPEKLDPDSPFNIGKLVLDPPAGKHGFCTAKDGDFYFADGTRAKFWGTNLCFDACFPTHEQAEMLAERIAFFGFNAVRFHHMDNQFEPRGIFRDVAPNQKNNQKKKTGVLSKTQLDHMDYLIYQLKKRGIYIDLNLLVSRHFTAADGVRDAAKLGMAGKPASMFDPQLIKLQQKYARDLLTHYNPYTKLRYCDDPAVALIEITNENCISENSILPPYYQDRLDRLVRPWQKKYPEATRKELLPHLEKQYFETMVTFLRKKLNIRVPIAGSSYASPGVQATCDFIDRHIYWDHPKFPGRSWDRDNFTIQNKSALQDPDLGIINKLIANGREAAKKGKPFTVTEWNHCYPNQYAYETPILLAETAANEAWDALFQFAFSHGWRSKPETDNIQSYFDILGNAQQLILCGLASYVYLTGNKLDYETITGEGVVFLPPQSTEQYSIGEIKNTNSGWKDGKFDWGTRPALIKKTKRLPEF